MVKYPYNLSFRDISAMTPYQARNIVLRPDKGSSPSVDTLPMVMGQ